MRMLRPLSWLLATVLCSAVVFRITLPQTWPYADPDAVVYLEATRSLVAGKGLAVQPWGWEEFENGWEPLAVFPPGFPLLAYLCTGLGLTPEQTIIWLPRAAYLLLLSCLYLTLRHVMGRVPAWIAAMIATWTVATVYHASLAMSGLPYLVVSTLGLSTMFAALSSGRAGLGLTAGTLGGAGMALRNIGIVAPVAIGGGLLAASFMRLWPRRTVFRLGAAYGAGVTLTYAPVLVRNLVVFGTPQPWVENAQPATIRCKEVPQELLEAASWLSFGSLVDWRIFAFLLLLSLGATAWLIARWHSRHAGHVLVPGRALAAGILALYGLLGVSLLMGTRCTFELDSIGDRFLLQYQWIAVAGVVALASALRPARFVPRVLWAVSVAVLSSGFSLGQREQLWSARDTIAWASAAVAAHEPLRKWVERLPQDTVIVSVIGPQLRMRFGRSILQLADVTPAELAAAVCSSRQLVVLLYPPEDDLGIGSWAGGLSGQQVPKGYRMLAHAGPVRALGCSPPSADQHSRSISPSASPDDRSALHQ